MSQVQKHSHSVLEHCACLLQLFCSCGLGIKFVFSGVVGTQKTTGFLIKNEYKISHLKGLQRTTPDGRGALTFT